MIGGIVIGLLFAAIVFYLIGLTGYLAKITSKVEALERKNDERLEH